MNSEKCNEWDKQRKSPTPRNPLTNRAIKKDGPKYKELDRDCDKFRRGGGGRGGGRVAGGGPVRVDGGGQVGGDGIVDINLICTQWLKDNHNALYNQLGARAPSPVRARAPSPVRARAPPPVRAPSPPRAPSPDSPQPCDEWVKQRKSPSPRNPHTNRVIKKGGPKYKELEKECDEFIKKDQPPRQLPVPPVPPVQVQPPRQQPPPNKGGPGPARKRPPPPSLSPLRSDESAWTFTSETSGESEVYKVKLSSTFYTVKERKKTGITIKNYFSTIVIPDGKACMTNSKTLQKYVSNAELLGRGSFGNVYSANIPRDNISVAIKEGRITLAEYSKALRQQYPIEYLYNKLINDLIDDLVCPNFAYSYVIFFCNQCTLDLVHTKMTAKCSETIVELFHATINQIGDVDMQDNKVVESLLFQILFALASIQIKYGMTHNDIKQENILVKLIIKGGYWTYNLDGKTYRVPNYGYIAALNDFGVSSSLKPGISQANYGVRQAEVIRDSSTGQYYFKPFTTKSYPYLTRKGAKPQNIPSPVLEDGVLTQNKFHKDFDSKPSIAVDLEDFRRFPVQSFNLDIMDVIFMFTGGKRTLQPGTHPGLTRREQFKNLLKYFQLADYPAKWPTNGTHLFLASHAIMKLFPHFKQKVEGTNIETYNL